MSIPTQQLTKYLKALEDLGYEVSFSFSGWSVTYEGDPIASRGVAVRRCAKTMQEHAQYRNNIGSVLCFCHQHIQRRHEGCTQ